MWSDVLAKPLPPSVATIQREQDSNVASYDERLNNPEELWRFVVQYTSEMPTWEVEIEGFDSPTNYSPRDYRDNEVRVDEIGISGERNPRFFIVLDLEGYLPRAPYRIVDVQGRPINAAIQDYATSTNDLKELVVTKQLHWDFEELKHAVYGMVRQAGWDGLVDIRVKIGRNKVYARSGSTVSLAANDPCVQCLCFITCLWICAAPAKSAAGKKIASLVVEYPAIAPVREFYDRNYWLISDAVRNRVTQRVRACGID
jgi:hypothetical protein